MKKKIFAALVALALVALVGLRAPTRAQGDDKSEKKDKENTELLAAVGGLGATACYFTFGFVGTVADGVGSGKIEPAKAKAMADEAALMTKRNADQLRALKKAGSLSEADAKSVDEFISLLDEIHDYANDLAKFTHEKTQANAQAFEEQRKKTWAHLKKVLGIK